MGESIYKFSLREIPGAFLRAWNLEKVRLERVGKGVWSLDNEIIPPLMITLAVYTALVLALGPNPKLLVFLPIQVAFGGWQLTSANYIEHYGQIGRASCRERVCQNVEISVVDVTIKK